MYLYLHDLKPPEKSMSHELKPSEKCESHNLKSDKCESNDLKPSEKWKSHDLKTSLKCESYDLKSSENCESHDLKLSEKCESHDLKVGKCNDPTIQPQDPDNVLATLRDTTEVVVIPDSQQSTMEKTCHLSADTSTCHPDDRSVTSPVTSQPTSPASGMIGRISFTILASPGDLPNLEVCSLDVVPKCN